MGSLASNCKRLPIRWEAGMMEKEEKISRYEERLLRRENDLRRGRIFGILMSLCIFAPFVLAAVEADGIALLGSLLLSWFGVFFLLAGQVCSAQLKHIDSIKKYRNQLKEQGEASASQPPPGN